MTLAVLGETARFDDMAMSPQCKVLQNELRGICNVLSANLSIYHDCARPCEHFAFYLF